MRPNPTGIGSGAFGFPGKFWVCNLRTGHVTSSYSFKELWVGTVTKEPVLGFQWCSGPRVLHSSESNWDDVSLRRGSKKIKMIIKRLENKTVLGKVAEFINMGLLAFGDNCVCVNTVGCVKWPLSTRLMSVAFPLQV